MKRLGHDNFELIFVSSDHGKKEMGKYMDEAKMPWPALLFGRDSFRTIARYKGDGIPCLVITDEQGNVLFGSYMGNEYVGPGEPKDKLKILLAVSKRMRELNAN